MRSEHRWAWKNTLRSEFSSRTDSNGKRIREIAYIHGQRAKPGIGTPIQFRVSWKRYPAKVMQWVDKDIMMRHYRMELQGYLKEFVDRQPRSKYYLRYEDLVELVTEDDYCDEDSEPYLKHTLTET